MDPLADLRALAQCARKAADDQTAFAERVSRTPVTNPKFASLIADVERRARDGASRWRVIAALLSLQISVIERG